MPPRHHACRPLGPAYHQLRKICSCELANHRGLGHDKRCRRPPWGKPQRLVGGGDICDYRGQRRRPASRTLRYRSANITRHESTREGKRVDSLEGSDRASREGRLQTSQASTGTEILQGSSDRSSTYRCLAAWCRPTPKRDCPPGVGRRWSSHISLKTLLAMF